MRRSGIILPIFSLPSNYGIGTFGEEAYKFVDFLKEAGQTYWQVLPMGPTSYGDSPYQSFSTFAGNPYFIDLDILSEEELLSKEYVGEFNQGENDKYIDYEKVYNSRYKILKSAYNEGKYRYSAEFTEFKEENKEWLFDYSLFMALKDHFGGVAWNTWNDDIKRREENAIKHYSTLLADEVDFYGFLQFLFYKQWNKLKEYANHNGVDIIGDVPIYVAEDSADIWANPQFFMLDEDLLPKEVSGCPPDAFSADGQLWGNPIYNWKALKNDGYKWWIERIKAAYKLVDVVRIDHFRGFESYWSIPYGDETAVNGTWEKGPGVDIFDAIKEELGDIRVIAEDLGFITDEVRALLDATGYPGMKILQFGFDPTGDSEYLPHNYEKNTIAYTGTHDNETVKGWYVKASEEEQEYCKKYTGMKNEDDGFEAIRCVMASCADTAIVQMQDLLNEGIEARMNIPSTLGINWKWRMVKSDITEDITEELKKLTEVYRR